MKKTTLLKLLLIIPTFFLALPGRSQTFFESFDGVAFPPTGWTNTHSAGDDPTAVWNRATTRDFSGQSVFFDSLFVDPHSGAGMAKFDCWTFTTGNSGLLASANINLSAVTAPQIVKFWIFRDNGLSELDSVSVYINTTQGLTGASYLGKVTRYPEGDPNTPGNDGWYQYSFSIPATFNTASNYLLFRAVSDYGNSIYIDDVTVEDKPVAPTCTTNISPANGATVSSPQVDLSWNPVAGAASYVLYIGTTNPPTDSLGDFSATATSITAFDANTTFYWYIKPVNISGAAVGCESNVTTFVTAAGPSNDSCATAVSLTVNNGFCEAPALGTLSFANESGLGVPTCSSSALPFDVWYTVTVPATGNVTIQTSAVNEDVVDVVVEAYQGTCGSLTSIGCNDDGNPDGFPSNLHSKLGLTGRTPGEVIYVRVMPYSGTDAGAFAICAFDTSTAVMPSIALGTPNACTPALPINIDSAFKYTWVTFKDAGGNVVAQIYPNGNRLGVTNASFYVNSGAVRRDGGGVYYLDRNLTIEPTMQPTAEILTSVYFTDAEFTALTGVLPGLSIDSLNCTKTTQTCATSARAAQGGTFILQGGAGDYMNGHFADLVHDSYSTFYLHAGNTVLPVSLVAFNAQRTGRVNNISWTTAQEINTSYFVIERSADGRNYTAIGQINAAGNSSVELNYSFIDYTPARGTNFYRLRIVDNSGHEKFSAVKNVRNEGTADISVYPNPVRDRMMVNITSDNADKAMITIADMNGKTVYTKTMNINEGMNYINVNTNNISSGTYVIKIQLNEDMVVRKFNKF